MPEEKTPEQVNDAVRPIRPDRRPFSQGFLNWFAVILGVFALYYLFFWR